ncbi:helix-turn-helix transcriptional regulator [Pyxidicoccus parkwayensis]|uniref:Helix-turn-helix transcriptional regulator n=2 Tax=Pyxidicoccus parkwayensis TaxID=2813578 RepID=A0ABX7PDD6_9BACT|nr:AraC family transcriptional regulator [Pyxidicoccus parkwaysis]QSQ28422.1 helix-turn-helix transcriptional regulator [Pyxidicoccus parkwaysis]
MPSEPHSTKHDILPSRREFEEKRLPVLVERLQVRSPVPRGPSAVHTYAVVILVTRGQSQVRHAGEWMLRAGDVHLIPPGDPHRMGVSDAEGWGLGFHPEVLGGAGGEGASLLGPWLRVRQGCHPVLQPTLAQRRRLLRWMRLLKDEVSRAERGSEEAVISLLRLVLIELERVSRPAAVPESPSAGLSRKALTYIETHCVEPLSLAKVAKAVGRSAAHVAGVVRQETGRTVGEWILECRMAEARRRLRVTDERVDIIGERVGYADVTHFIRQFRRVHGVTPAAWRRRVSTPAT